ncbi:hypothetical protein M514_10742 [Trichuris suis]|uniref:Uncharacterized protein n=1 Tax=Trichuris suis TaxID=68888 RepID=A0A085LTU4_9BILA|nr:hypothetical protein M513_10742 [Trichuris suis]KFD61110.1 hypothetical protein M514_10742 [Trichuris suis]
MVNMKSSNFNACLKSREGSEWSPYLNRERQEHWNNRHGKTKQIHQRKRNKCCLRIQNVVRIRQNVRSEYYHNNLKNYHTKFLRTQKPLQIMPITAQIILSLTSCFDKRQRVVPEKERKSKGRRQSPSRLPVSLANTSKCTQCT